MTTTSDPYAGSRQTTEGRVYTVTGGDWSAVRVLGPVGMDYLHGHGIQSADIATDPVAAVGRIGAALENLAPEAREQFDRLAHATLRKHDLLQAA